MKEISFALICVASKIHIGEIKLIETYILVGKD